MSIFRGSALRWAQRDEGGFRFPPYIPLDSHTPLKRPGLWSWTWGCMISFANPYGSRVATLVVWGGEWEVQEGLGRASKPSPTLLAPAERVLLKLQIVRIILFVNKTSLLQIKRHNQRPCDCRAFFICGLMPEPWRHLMLTPKDS